MVVFTHVMNWRVIFYRSASGKCAIEEFIEDLPVEDAKEIVASVAALREVGTSIGRLFGGWNI